FAILGGFVGGGLLIGGLVGRYGIDPGKDAAGNQKSTLPNVGKGLGIGAGIGLVLGLIFGGIFGRKPKSEEGLDRPFLTLDDLAPLTAWQLKQLSEAAILRVPSAPPAPAPAAGAAAPAVAAAKPPPKTPGAPTSADYVRARTLAQTLPFDI